MLNFFYFSFLPQDILVNDLSRDTVKYDSITYNDRFLSFLTFGSTNIL